MCLFYFSCENTITNNSDILDCDNIPNGSASVDDCGLCTRGTTIFEFNYLMDCGGVCGGSALEDCAGICNGSAVLDECDVCGGDGAMPGYGCDGTSLCTPNGDANEDGNINVTDIVITIEFILNDCSTTSEWTECNNLICSSDVNSDGVLNVSDIVVIVANIIGN